MSHRGRPESQQSQYDTSALSGSLSPIDTRAHKVPKTRLEMSPDNCKTEDEYMAALATIARDAAELQKRESLILITHRSKILVCSCRAPRESRTLISEQHVEQEPR